MNIFLTKFFQIISPSIARAQDIVIDNTPDPSGGNGTGNSGVDNITINFENPLGGPGGVNNLMELVAALIDIVITVGIPIVTLAIIYTGYLFVIARGDTTKIKEARTAFTWTVIGAVILLASWVIAQAIHGTVNQIINS